MRPSLLLLRESHGPRHWAHAARRYVPPPRPAGPYDDYQEMLDFSLKHGIKPKIELMPASEVNAAIAKVRNNTARYRVVLEF